METTKDIGYYTLTNIRQRLFLIAVKRWVSTPEAMSWQDADESLKCSLNYIFSSSDDDSYLWNVFYENHEFPQTKEGLIERLKPKENLSKQEKEEYKVCQSKLLSQIQRIESFSDPEQIEEFVLSSDSEQPSRLKEAIILRKILSNLSNDIKRDIELYVGASLILQLKLGGIIGSGYLTPIDNTSVRIKIPSAHWMFLEINNETDSAESDNCSYKYIDLSFSTPEGKGKTKPYSITSQAKSPAPRGKATKMDKIKIEMTRRANARPIQLKPTLKEECIELAEWCRTKHSHLYEYESIQKKLGKHYKELKAQNPII